MSLYAKIDRATMIILTIEDKNDPKLTDNPNKPKWVPVIEGVKPAFDGATHRLVMTETVTLASVERTWAKVVLTANELRDRINPLIDLRDALIAKGVLTKSDLQSRLGR